MPGFIRFAANNKNAKLNPCPASSSFSDQTSHYLSDAACIQKPCCLCWTCELISPLMSSSEQFKPKGPVYKASWKRILICILDTCLCWETMSSGLSKSLLWMLLVHGWKAGIANILPPCHMLWICISGQQSIPCYIRPLQSMSIYRCLSVIVSFLAHVLFISMWAQYELHCPLLNLSISRLFLNSIGS